MEKNDTFFNQFKSLADTLEKEPFPAKESIWDRVETKLDQKALTQENKTWKKIAVAASVLLVVTLGFISYNSATKSVQTVPVAIPNKEEVVTAQPNSIKVETPSKEETVLVEDKAKVLVRQIRNPESVAINTITTKESKAQEITVKVSIPTPSKLEIVEDKIATNQGYFNSVSSTDYGFKDNRKYVARAKEQEAKFIIQGKSKKEDPLVVVDGKAVTEYDTTDAESVVYLKNPLYIINGTEYSEVEVFGPNPTCPYAPIKNQEIESVTVLQADKAIDTYGKKGENGVVIIITKDGKPNPKK
ncbi:MAG: hypothetical protein RL607_2370 [Bacteroidota bacterium]|jgi:hypothetical protein